ncbi:hypothetical protein CVD28_07810 [Bacillus sp. M6-12]|uniref:hypothetical protein n=1 Tax=Bacillus sp. M6-12 TaxID=2054166 RepID=UPI000C79091E|nr:hypothetical protein [Bacillus sp. M6-12]PLS18187.1 hypothetical protein CVD28_07810 [Bacillus sp. M6-12]
MNKENWDKFIKLWEKGAYEEAVKLRLNEANNGGTSVVNQLFRNPTVISTSIVGISFTDILYDYLMINPSVIDAIDFARSEDLSSFFAFQQLAETFEFSNTGEITRLKGYTAEQLVALELQGKGHDVSFPETSNQAGFDLIVDGQPFQVKCLNDPSGVYTHFRSYPDTPVFVNKELMSTFEDNPLVYGTEVSFHTVEEMTQTSLKHAAEFSQLDIPLITIAVSSLTNGYKILSDGLEVRLAGFNIVNDTVSRSVAGLAGKGAGVIIGPLFGPAGVVVLPMIFGLAGAYNGKKLSSFVKKLYTQKEREQVQNNLIELIQKVLQSLPEKMAMRESSFNKVKEHITRHKVLNHITKLLTSKYNEKQKYTANKKVELEEWLLRLQSNKYNIEAETQHILDTIFRSQVHPFLYQKELKDLGGSYKKLMGI